MTYKCLIIGAILNGVAYCPQLPEDTLDDLVNVIRDHLADHGFYKVGDFEKLWEQTYFLDAAVCQAHKGWELLSGGSIYSGPWSRRSDKQLRSRLYL